jgi:hypothetical protein
MLTGDADEFVAFEDARVVRSTAPALLCLVQGREIWLPRMHVAGKLWCAGDRGKLLIRRWVALDRQLVVPAAHGGPRSVPPAPGSVG